MIFDGTTAPNIAYNMSTVQKERTLSLYDDYYDIVNNPQQSATPTARPRQQTEVDDGEYEVGTPPNIRQTRALQGTQSQEDDVEQREEVNKLYTTIT